MAWQIKYDKKAKKQLSKLPSQDKERIDAKLQEISELENPRERGKSLQGKYSDKWRYRIGNYRVICDIRDEELVILVVQAGHRKEIYKQ